MSEISSGRFLVSFAPRRVRDLWVKRLKTDFEGGLSAVAELLVFTSSSQVIGWEDHLRSWLRLK